MTWKVWTSSTSSRGKLSSSNKWIVIFLSAAYPSSPRPKNNSSWISSPLRKLPMYLGRSSRSKNDAISFYIRTYLLNNMKNMKNISFHFSFRIDSISDHVFKEVWVKILEVVLAIACAPVAGWAIIFFFPLLGDGWSLIEKWFCFFLEWFCI